MHVACRADHPNVSYRRDCAEGDTSTHVNYIHLFCVFVEHFPLNMFFLSCFAAGQLHVNMRWWEKSSSQ